MRGRVRRENFRSRRQPATATVTAATARARPASAPAPVHFLAPEEGQLSSHITFSPFGGEMMMMIPRPANSPKLPKRAVLAAVSAADSKSPGSSETKRAGEGKGSGTGRGRIRGKRRWGCFPGAQGSHLSSQEPSQRFLHLETPPVPQPFGGLIQAPRYHHHHFSPLKGEKCVK